MHSFILRLAAALVLIGLPSVVLAAKAPTKIDAIKDMQSNPLLNIKIGDEIQVCLDGDEAIDPTKWQLFLDGRAVTDDKSVRRADKARCIVFTLHRSDATSAAWASLLGRPNAAGRSVAISVDRSDRKDGQTDRLVAEDMKTVILDLARGSGLEMGLIVLLILTLAFAVFLRKTEYAILRDRLLPVIESNKQPFSLGRLQMTIWFVLVAAAWVFLLAYINEYNTLSVPALKLMGISAATGLGAIAANGANNDDLKAALAQLDKVGWNTPGDVPDEKPQAADVDKLSAWKWVKEYETQGLFKDLFYDENGSALHRLQVLFWTIALGFVFGFGVWQNLAMPEFSDTLLALMAISGGSYVGFKVAEKV